MPDLLAQALSGPGLVWLLAAGLVAGVVRGFSGFGTAMVYMPVAGQWLDPFAALVTLTMMDVIGPLPNVPRALGAADKGDMLRLWTGLVVAMPLGVLALGAVRPEVFRSAVSLITLTLLLLLIAGIRYHGRLAAWKVSLTGALGGFLGGATGLAGPPVIMLYMASTHPARVIRANLLLYLLGVDLAMIAVLALMGRMEAVAVVSGLVIAGPYLAGNVLGGWLFRPELGRLYRGLAYLVIAISALSGLPLFDRP